MNWNEWNAVKGNVMKGSEWKEMQWNEWDAMSEIIVKWNTLNEWGAVKWVNEWNAVSSIKWVKCSELNKMSEVQWKEM